MNVQNELIDRNEWFAASFKHADLSILPKLRTVIVACGDARVDPAHVLGLELGEAVVLSFATSGSARSFTGMFGGTPAASQIFLAREFPIP